MNIQALDFGKEGFRPKRENWVVSIRTIQLADNLLCFYDGRNKAGEPLLGPDDNNWGQLDMDLGLCCYALFQGKEAVLIDTMLTPEQARYVRLRLGSLGVERFTVINTHMDMDHTGGNAVFADCEIIALKGTHDALVKYTKVIEAGELWGPPATNPLVLPNRLLDADTEMRLAGFDLKLLKCDAHQEGGSLCVLIPAYRAIMVGDVAEDAAVFVNLPAKVQTFIDETRRLLELDFDYVFPVHGNPDLIARGAYGKPFIEACIAYQERLLEKVEEPGFLDTEFTDFMGDYLNAGILHFSDVYAGIHKTNAENMYNYWVKEAGPGSRPENE